MSRNPLKNLSKTRALKNQQTKKKTKAYTLKKKNPTYYVVDEPTNTRMVQSYYQPTSPGRRVEYVYKSGSPSPAPMVVKNDQVEYVYYNRSPTKVKRQQSLVEESNVEYVYTKSPTKVTKQTSE